MLKKVILFWILVATLGYAGEKSTVAVVDFQGIGVSLDAVKKVTDRFSYELSQFSDIALIEREMMELILKEQSFQLTGCTSSECVVQIGELLAVQYIIAGTLSRTDDLYSLHVRLIDVGSAGIISQHIEDYNGSMKSFLKDAVADAALKLLAGSSLVSIEELLKNENSKTLANLSISGIPEGSQIVLNGNLSGQIPLRQNLMKSGSYNLEINKTGYVTYRKKIQLKAQQNMAISVKLQSVDDYKQNFRFTRRRQTRFCRRALSVLVLSAGVTELSSRILYQNYLDSKNTRDADRLYKLSNTLHRISALPVGSAALIAPFWLKFEIDLKNKKYRYEK